MFTRHKPYSIYQKTKTKALNIVVILAMMVSSVATPLVFSRTAAADPSAVALTSPTGGESWTIGSMHDITWNNTNGGGQMDINYSPNGGSSWATVMASFSSNNGANSYSWDTTGLTPTTTARIQLVKHNNTKVYATSGNFTLELPAITPPANQAPSVPTLSAPANGTIRQSDTTDPITNQSVWLASTDPEGDDITYVYQSAFDAAFTDVAYTSSPLTDTFILNPNEPEVTYYWHVKAVDEHGAASAWSEAWSITIDNTAPELPVHLSPLNNSFQNFNDFYFDWTSVSGAVEYEFQSATSPATDSNGALTTGVWNNKLHGAPDRDFLSDSTIHSYGADGTWYWQVRAIDGVGNKTAWTTPWKVTIDMSAPSVPTITKPASEQYFTSSPILNQWTASSDDSGIAKYQISYQYDDGHSFGSSTCDGTTLGIGDSSKFIGCRDVNGTQRNHVPSSSEQGGVTIWVRAQDNAGNWSAWSDSVHYYYDETPPSVPINGWPHLTTLTSNVFNYTWNPSTDNVSGVTYEYQASQNPAQTGGVLTNDLWQNWVNGDASQNPLNNPLIPSVGTSDGTWYWQVRAVDTAGNKSAWSDIWHYTLDSFAPDVPTATLTQDSNNANVPNGGYTNSEFFTFSLNSSSDVARYQLKYWNDIVGSPFKELTPWNPSDITATGHMATLGTYTDNFTQGEGVHYFAFSTCDTAGNCSAYSAPFVVTFDKTAPDVQITGFGQTANVIQPNVTATDPSMPLTYSWTTNAGVTISNTNALNPTFTVNDDASYVFELTVTDAAGNSATVPFSFTYTTPTQQQEETTPPTPPFTNVQSVSTGNPPTPTPLDDDQGGATDSEVLSTSVSEPGNVEGASTELTENAAGASKFFGLGWWWLAILGAFVAFWLLFFRRRSDEEN